jgi:hypothetical protein
MENELEIETKLKITDVAEKSKGVTFIKEEKLVDEPSPPSPDFASAIYETFKSIFGNNNPTQMFSLCWPGTVLDPESLGVDESSSTIPLSQLIKTSRIMDAYVPPSPITQPDGTRVSSRYKTVLSQLSPKVNKELAELQAIVREKIDQPMKITVDGESKEMPMVGVFYLLSSKWIKVKSIWGSTQQAELTTLENKYPSDPKAQYEEFLKWYETNADSNLASINAAYYELITQFPLTQWNDAISILDTQDDGSLNNAKTILRNAVLPVPPQEGFTYLPTNSIPATWTNQIKPTTSFIDFLSDPELQKSTLETALNRLEAEIGSWRAIIPQIDDATVLELSNKLNKASDTYRKTQLELRNTYTENTVTAVEVFIDIYKAKGESLSEESDKAKEEDITKKVNNLAKSLDKSDSNHNSNVEDLDWDQIKDAASKIGAMQNKVNGSQDAMIQSGIELANTASAYLEAKGKSSNMKWLQSYIDQLSTCCDKAQAQLKNFASSSSKYAEYLSTATPIEVGLNPNHGTNFGNKAFPEAISDPKASTWSEYKVSIDKSSMNSKSDLSTYFSQSDWGVNFFLGSASGTDMESGSDFAEEFMDENSKIELGCLATKVVIDRPWMMPEIFNNTSSMFRTLETAISPSEPFDVNGVNTPNGEKELIKLINNYQMPSYPVAFLVVKDLCVKVTLVASKTERARDAWNSKKSQGGGFFCFSVSSTTVEESDNESTNSYAMAGQLILRSPTPQIIGYFSQLVPPDKSEVLTSSTVKDITDSLGFLKDLKSVHESDAVDPMPKNPTL